MGKIIKIGPIHSVFESPFIIKLKQEDNIISDVEIEIGYSHRGIEGLSLQKTFLQTLELVERSCGLCSHTHTCCYCQAIEKLAQIKVPKRAQFIRVIISELERIHSHLFWASLVSNTLGFEAFKNHILTVRETIMEISEMISGNRVMFAINAFGGVRRDINDPKSIIKAIDKLKKPAEKLFEIFDASTEITEKTKDIGILDKKIAQNLGVVGPTARTSGIKKDIRKEAPYDAYRYLEFQDFIYEAGDTFSRILIHFKEIFESIKIIEQAIKNLPPGEIINPLKGSIPKGEATARVEAPRGELFYFVASDGSDKPRRVKIRVPTFANLPAVRYMLKEEKVENLNLVLGSIDPCFSCAER